MITTNKVKLVAIIPGLLGSFKQSPSPLALTAFPATPAEGMGTQKLQDGGENKGASLYHVQRTNAVEWMLPSSWFFTIQLKCPRPLPDCSLQYHYHNPRLQVQYLEITKAMRPPVHGMGKNMIRGETQRQRERANTAGTGNIRAEDGSGPCKLNHLVIYRGDTVEKKLPRSCFFPVCKRPWGSWLAGCCSVSTSCNITIQNCKPSLTCTEQRKVISVMSRGFSETTLQPQRRRRERFTRHSCKVVLCPICSWRSPQNETAIGGVVPFSCFPPICHDHEGGQAVLGAMVPMPCSFTCSPCSACAHTTYQRNIKHFSFVGVSIQFFCSFL
jgi:hypothetical protein